MAIAVLVLTLVAYGYVLLVYPEYRRPALLAGAVVAAMLALYFFRNPPETARKALLIPPEEITLADIEIERSIRGASLTARITNGSESYRLIDLTLALRLRDCPAADTATADCPVIGEARAIARPDVPPGQVRAVSAHFIFTDLPTVEGTPRWDWTITDTRATAERG